MKKMVKKVSNLFIDDVGRVNFTVGVVLNERPYQFSYRTIEGRKGLELFVNSTLSYHMVFNTLSYSITKALSLQSIRKWVYDNYDNFSRIYPFSLEVL